MEIDVLDCHVNQESWNFVSQGLGMPSILPCTSCTAKNGSAPDASSTHVGHAASQPAHAITMIQSPVLQYWLPLVFPFLVEVRLPVVPTSTIASHKFLESLPGTMRHL